MIKTLGGRRLKRTPSHRAALMRSLVTSLLLHEKIETPLAKAKELRRVADRTITRAKAGDHRFVRSQIQDKTVYGKLFEVLAPRYQARPSGYTQIFKTGRRRGDNAEMALVKLVG